jgi:hypothetical protein
VNACGIRVDETGGETLTFRTSTPLHLTLAQLRDPGQLQRTAQLPPLAATLTRHGTGTYTNLNDGTRRAVDNSGCGTASFTVPFIGVELGWEGGTSKFDLGLHRPGQDVFGANCPSLGWAMLGFHVDKQIATLTSANWRNRVIAGTGTMSRSLAPRVAGYAGLVGSTVVTWTLRISQP